MNANNQYKTWLVSRLFSPRLRLLVYVSLLVAGAGGCQQRTANQLLGRWVGRPDTAAARAERESQKYGDAPAAAQGDQTSVEAENVTDWERFDLGVKFDFTSRERVEMSLSDGSRPLSGKWRVISTSPVGCTIEVETERVAELSESDQPPATERRRFELELDERDGTCVGFTLTEVGADRQLGALYFRRPEGM